MTQFKISFAYELTKPGAQQYSSEKFRVAIDIDDEGIASQEAANAAVAALANEVKLAVINQAGLSAGADANGVVFPVFGGARSPSTVIDVAHEVANVTPISAAPSAQPADHFDNYGTPEYEQATQGVPVQQGQRTGAGKQMAWDGRPVLVYDNRAKKAAGEYKPNAADFKIKFLDVGEDAPDSVKFKSVWLQNQNKSVNQAGLTLQAQFDALP